MDDYSLLLPAFASAFTADRRLLSLNCSGTSLTTDLRLRALVEEKRVFEHELSGEPLHALGVLRLTIGPHCIRWRLEVAHKNREPSGLQDGANSAPTKEINRDKSH